MDCLRCLLWFCLLFLFVQLGCDIIRALRFEFSFQTDFAVAEKTYHYLWDRINGDFWGDIEEGDKVEPSFYLFYSMLKDIQPSFIVHEDYARFLYRYFTRTL